MGLKHFLKKTVKQAGSHGSVVARIGAKLDPVQRVLGLDKPSIAIADKSQSLFSKAGDPANKLDSKINPLRQIPVVDKVSNQINNRPVDAAATAAGAYFGGGALYGAFGGGGAAGGAGAGEVGVGGLPVVNVGTTATSLPASLGGSAAGSAAGGAAGGSGVGNFLGNYGQYIGPLISGAGQIAGAHQSAKADQAALDEIRRQYDINRNDLAPYRQVGTGALNNLAGLYGIGPDGQPTNQPVDYSQFTNSPEYQFNLREGLQGVQNSAAARGGLYSGNALKALQERGAGIASNQFGNYTNRLAALAGIGQSATDTGVQSGSNSATNVAQLLQSQGDARASGIVGAANTLGNAFGQYSGTQYGRRYGYPSYYGGA